MTIGSAASRTGHEPGAPRPFFRPFGPTTGLSLEPAPKSQGLPPRRLPARLADDSPLGRVPLIEDDAVVALDLQRILREAGYRVVGPAPSMADAESLMARGPIDCAVLDTDLKSGKAFAMADRLGRGGIPVVFVTSDPRQELAEKCAGRPVIRKPCCADEVLAAVERAISGGSDSESEIGYPTAPLTVSWPRVFPQL
jgi:CheY-like chemotaxis protein